MLKHTSTFIAKLRNKLIGSKQSEIELNILTEYKNGVENR